MEILDSQYDVYEHVKPRVYFPTDKQAAAIYDVEAIQYHRAYHGKARPLTDFIKEWTVDPKYSIFP